MQVLQIKTVEDCFDGSFIKEFELCDKISEDFIRKLGKGSFFEYFPDFPRPFFRIENKNIYQIKGVIGNHTMRVIFSRNCSSNCVDDLVTVINNL